MDKYPELPVLLVDDEEEILTGFQFTLASNGISNTETFSYSPKVIPYLTNHPTGVVLLDLSMPVLSGRELLKQIRSGYPYIKVIVVTGVDQVETAVACMKEGAFDYLVKPVESQRFVSSVKRAIELMEEQIEYRDFRKKVLTDTLDHPTVFDSIKTQNKAMRTLFQYTETVARSQKPVLITGESGVGKGLIAEAIYRLSGLKGNFVSVNVAGLDDNLFSDTLYGHVKGAFTGAAINRPGLVEQATGGILFLDEIGDLSIQSQVKLLNLMEEGTYYPVGSDIAKKANIKIITATNKSIETLKSSSSFRSDLFYRLRTHHVEIPPLRKRLDDIPLLAEHFLAEAADSLGKKKPTPPRELISLLSSYSFPGNIRELQAMVYDAVSHHQARILSMERFEIHIRNQGEPVAACSEGADDDATIFANFKDLPTLKDARKHLITEALNRSGNNSGVASRILGISRSGLNKIIQRDSD